MKQYELIAPCHFGMEAVLKREIQNLGYEISQVDNGKVTFFGDAAAIARANIFLRTTERILLKIDSFRATSFDDLFEAVKSNSVGGLHTGRRKVLGDEGELCEQ